MKTREVRIGNRKIGNGNPVLIQSMTNTDTKDIERTIAQILSLERAGCDIVRFTVYDMDCAKAVETIRRSVHIPIVADIHFDYRLAIAAIENGIDKIRFNPGNIGGREKVEELVSCARAHHIPIRIGVNAGSLEKDLKEQADELFRLLEQHVQATGSPRARAILESFGDYLPKFRAVIPDEYRKYLNE